jgi:hypothetical protein
LGRASSSVDQAHPLDASEVPSVPSGEGQVEPETRPGKQTVVHADLEPEPAESNVDLPCDERGCVIQGQRSRGKQPSDPVRSLREVRPQPEFECRDRAESDQVAFQPSCTLETPGARSRRKSMARSSRLIGGRLPRPPRLGDAMLDLCRLLLCEDASKMQDLCQTF